MHLIFDLDGTLFQTADTVTAAVWALFEELGLPRPEAHAV
jgi:phosphoglycolate phosphatase-like HAD superfamily hydrolase